MRRITLGTRELGTVDVMVKSAQFTEVPEQKSEDRSYTDKSLFLEIDLINLRELDRFYSKVTEGDIIEGLGEVKYYDIFGTTSPNKLSMFEIMTKNPDWNLYDYDIPEDTTFIVKII